MAASRPGHLGGGKAGRWDSSCWLAEYVNRGRHPRVTQRLLEAGDLPDSASLDDPHVGTVQHRN